MRDESTSENDNQRIEALKGIDRVVVETDEDSPVTIVVIEGKTIDVAAGYRVRCRPVYD